MAWTFRTFVISLCACCSTLATAQDAIPIRTIAVADGIHMLMGRGGNLAVSTGQDGILVVDDQYAEQYEVVKNAIDKLAPGGVKFLINTHWHSDHTGGNAQMESAGATIVAHENVRQRMSTDQVIEFFNAERPASPSAALPVITFKQDIAFHFNNEYIEVTHLKNAHTDSDAMIHFRGTNVIHTGDTFFHGRYPFIDTGSGGSVGGIIAAADRIIALSDEKTQIIPGHGELTDKQGVIEYRNMLNTIHKAIATLIVSGNSVEQVVLAKPTAQFDDKWGNAFLKPDTFVKMLYDSIKRATLN